MKKKYQKPVTESHVIELQPLMDGQSIEVSSQTQDNNHAFSRESGWDYDD